MVCLQWSLTQTGWRRSAGASPHRQQQDACAGGLSSLTQGGCPGCSLTLQHIVAPTPVTPLCTCARARDTGFHFPEKQRLSSRVTRQYAASKPGDGLQVLTIYLSSYLQPSIVGQRDQSSKRSPSTYWKKHFQLSCRAATKKRHGIMVPQCSARQKNFVSIKIWLKQSESDTCSSKSRTIAAFGTTLHLSHLA